MINLWVHRRVATHRVVGQDNVDTMCFKPFIGGVVFGDNAVIFTGLRNAVVGDECDLNPTVDCVHELLERGACWCPSQYEKCLAVNMAIWRLSVAWSMSAPIWMWSGSEDPKAHAGIALGVSGPPLKLGNSCVGLN